MPDPQRFDDEQPDKVVPPCAVDRYIRNLARLRQLCIDRWDLGRVTMHELETGMAEIQAGLEHHRSAYLDAEKAEHWQSLRDRQAYPRRI